MQWSSLCTSQNAGISRRAVRPVGENDGNPQRIKRREKQPSDILITVHPTGWFSHSDFRNIHFIRQLDQFSTQLPKNT